MHEEKKFPIVVGVTGHREYIGADTAEPVIREELKRIKAMCPNSPLVILSSLADGADRQCAKIALEEGYTMIVALPMEKSEYANDFSKESLEEFEELLSKAEDVFIVPDTEPHKETREYCYRQADIYIAEHCHLLMALWDGSEPVEGGCGTAETVDIRLNNSYEVPEERNICPDNGLVAHIKVSREEASEQVSCGIEWKGDKASFESVMKKTDEYNKEVGKTDAKDRLSAADKVSILNQKHSGRTLLFIAVIATAITTAFLLYDEASMHMLIIACGVFIVSLILRVRIAERNRYLLKYLEARVLAEALRIGEYMDKSSSVCASDLFTWSMWTDNPWVGWAVRAVHVVEHGKEIRGLGKDFIESQKKYHEKALARVEKKNRTNGNILLIALIITIISYVVALVFEITAGGLFSGNLLMSPERLEWYRSLLKIVMGVMSAATLFAGNYYGKLSMEEEADDHKRMILLFENAKSEYGEKLSYKLIREMLGENARWYSYKSRGKAEISL